ncbi:hypothetical protein Pcinc_042629 [Petrolisthes cinctipes]|uniref:Uncharacterized protein n=1 Tax=Petrolisthes cinctipes TaxID=88211 RepID=A0AAE1EGU1_PETCI|nr:hypothetical protein Pcinc_042629 [Petrolisthes cinctipes]
MTESAVVERGEERRGEERGLMVAVAGWLAGWLAGVRVDRLADSVSQSVQCWEVPRGDGLALFRRPVQRGVSCVVCWRIDRVASCSLRGGQVPFALLGQGIIVITSPSPAS